VQRQRRERLSHLIRRAHAPALMAKFVYQSLSLVMRHGDGRLCRGAASRGVGTLHRERVSASRPRPKAFGSQIRGQIAGYLRVR
jgi:hypothetical protein